MAKFDFSGWATKANLKCSAGRTIMNLADTAPPGCGHCFDRVGNVRFS